MKVRFGSYFEKPIGAVIVQLLNAFGLIVPYSGCEASRHQQYTDAVGHFLEVEEVNRRHKRSQYKELDVCCEVPIPRRAHPDSVSCKRVVDKEKTFKEVRILTVNGSPTHRT